LIAVVLDVKLYSIILLDLVCILTVRPSLTIAIDFIIDFILYLFKLCSW